MNRTEFFTKLNSSLSVLSESERRDIIDEYTSHIDFKMQDGKTEEQAIADFGNIESLTDEILEAYHIDHNIAKSKNLEYYIKAVVSFINKATGKLLSLPGTEIAKIVVEFCLVLCVIFLIGIPFNGLRHSLYDITSYLPQTVSSIINTLVRLVCELLNISLSLLIIYSFINIRLLSKYSDNNTHSNYREDNMNNHDYQDTFSSEPEYSFVEKQEGKQPFEETVENQEPQNNDFQNNISPDSEKDNKTAPKGGNSYSTDGYANKNLNFDPHTGRPLKKLKKVAAQSAKSSSSFLVSTTVLLLKIFLFLCILLPFIFISIFGVVATVVLLVLLILKGIGLWGIILMALGGCVISIAITVALTTLIFGGKKTNA